MWHSLQKRFTNIKKEYLYLSVVILIAALTRFYVLPSTRWSGDPARDLLVSQHILTYHETPNIGHVASGTNPISYYPPVYYYLLAFLRLPSLNIWYILSVFVLCNVAGIGIFYLIAGRLSRPLSACIATTLYACSSYYLERQTTLSSMHFILPVFMLGFLLHLIGIQKRKMTYILSGLFLIVLAGSINYAALILLPVFFIWIYLTFKHQFRKTILSIFFSIVLICVLFSRFARFIISTYSWTTFINPLLPSNNIAINNNLIARFIEQYKNLSTTIFPFATSFIMISICFLIVSLLIYQNKKRAFFILYPLSFVIFTLVLGSIKNTEFGSYYYYLVAPFLFIMISKCIEIPISHKVFKFIPLIFLIIVFYSVIQQIPSVLTRVHTYQDSERIADSIIKETAILQKSKGYKDFHFFQITALNKNNNEWEGLQYSYFLEQKTGKSFRVYDHYNNLQWINENDYVVMICMEDPKTSLQWCRDYFTLHYPSFILLKQIQSDSSTVPIFIYKNLPHT